MCAKFGADLAKLQAVKQGGPIFEPPCMARDFSFLAIFKLIRICVSAEVSHADWWPNILVLLFSIFWET